MKVPSFITDPLPVLLTTIQCTSVKQAKLSQKLYLRGWGGGKSPACLHVGLLVEHEKRANSDATCHHDCRAKAGLVLQVRGERESG